MNCRHCGDPIERCTSQRDHPCRGWKHSADGFHPCYGNQHIRPLAEPEPGTLPVVEAPTGKPDREVA